MSTTDITEVDFTPEEDSEVTFTPEAEEPNTLCGCEAIRITPHIFVEGMCEPEDEDPEDE